jgi:hypothetical protein
MWRSIVHSLPWQTLAYYCTVLITAACCFKEETPCQVSPLKANKCLELLTAFDRFNKKSHTLKIHLHARFHGCVFMRLYSMVSCVGPPKRTAL